MSDSKGKLEIGVGKSFLRLCMGLIITFSLMIAAFIAVMGVAYVIDIPKLKSILNGGDYTGSLTGYICYTVIAVVQEGTFLAGPLIAAHFAFKWTSSKLGFNSLKKHHRDFLVGLLGGFVIMTLVFLVYNMSGCIEFTKQNSLEPSFCMILLFTYALVALGEEVFSRGLFMATMRNTGSRFLVFFVPSVFFGLMHLANNGVTFLSLVNLIGLGLVLGYAFYKSGSLWLPIGCHFTWNFFQGVVYGFMVSGNKTDSIVSIKVSGNKILTGGTFGPEGGIVISILLILFFIFLKFYYRNETYDFMND